MKILLVTETLSVGGAETFVLRLAGRLAQDHEVILANLHPRYSHPDMVAQLPDRVTYCTPVYRNRGLLDKADSALLKLGLDRSTAEHTIVAFLAGLIRRHRPDAVHSHLFKPDYYVALAGRRAGHTFSHVTTNHGDYLLYERKPPARILHYPRKLATALGSIRHFVNISDEQLAFTDAWRRAGMLPPGLQVHKILNGYAAADQTRRDRAALGIGADEFVFGMVARGIPEKGWAALAAAFKQAAVPRSRLLLVGQGPAIDDLKREYGADPRFVFAGFSAVPVEYIRLFDLGLLPSYYAAESLPTVIIEYLCCGKPVVATDVGEIRLMTTGAAGQPAAVLVPLGDDGRPDVPALAAAMQQLASDRALYQTYQSHTAAAFEQFDMERCINQYLSLYQQP